MALMDNLSFDMDMCISTDNKDVRVIISKKINLIEGSKENIDKLVEVFKKNQNYIGKCFNKEIKWIDLKQNSDELERILYYNHTILDNLILFIENPHENTEILQKLINTLEQNVELSIKVFILAAYINSGLVVLKSNENVNVVTMTYRESHNREIINIKDGDKIDICTSP